LLVPDCSGCWKQLAGPAQEVLEFIVRAAEEYALPVLTIARYVLEEVPQEEVTLPAACSPAIEEFRAPIGRDGLSLWSGLGTPGYRRGVLWFVALSTHPQFLVAAGL